jgi:hypothetical protein
MSMLPSHFPEVQAYPDLKRVIERLVDMQFADLRDLMRLPAYTVHSGMNLTTAARLFDVISGCSICFYNSTSELAPNRVIVVDVEGLEERLVQLSPQGRRCSGVGASAVTCQVESPFHVLLDERLLAPGLAHPVIYPRQFAGDPMLLDLQEI